MLTSDNSDPAARAASTDSVGSTHSDPRAYSDSASRRIMASLPHADAFPHVGQSPQNTGPTLTTGWHDPVPVNRSSRDAVTVNERGSPRPDQPLPQRGWFHRSVRCPGQLLRTSSMAVPEQMA